MEGQRLSSVDPHVRKKKSDRDSKRWKSNFTANSTHKLVPDHCLSPVHLESLQINRGLCCCVAPLETRQPLPQRRVKKVAGDLARRKIGVQVKTMLRVRHDVAKDTVLAGLHIALGDLRCEGHALWCDGLGSED